MRTVLFLINGFGIEKKDSYSVYDANVMPNFDKLTKQYIFSPIETGVRSIYDGFRNMSLEKRELYNYSIFEEKLNTNLLSNPVYKDIDSVIKIRKSKLHVFCFIDTSLKIVENLKLFLKNINKENSRKIYLHLILTSNNFEDYPIINDILSKINIELGDYAKVGMVLGFQNITNNVAEVDLNFLLRNMISELGEQWSSYRQKLDVSYGMKQSPNQIKPFIINKGFSVEKDDLFLIWNYDNVNISNFIGGIKAFNYGDKETNQIKFYSLFPLQFKEPIPSMLEFEVSKNSLANNMRGLGFKTLVLTDKDSVSGINYYLNGLSYVNNPDITYMAIDNENYSEDSILKIINESEQDFVILNLDITKIPEQTVSCLKDKLTKVDSLIGKLYENFKDNKYNVVISSLYGVNRTLLDTTGEVCNLSYSKVPFVYLDGLINKKNYIANPEADISGIFKVCYRSINRKYYGECFVEKKNFLYRLVFK